MVYLSVKEGERKGGYHVGCGPEEGGREKVVIM